MFGFISESDNVLEGGGGGVCPVPTRQSPLLSLYQSVCLLAYYFLFTDFAKHFVK